MEMDLNNVIEQIKREGVEQGEKQAADIVKEAEKKAGEIVAQAEKDKDDIIKSGREDADRLMSNGEAALRQASRDVLVALRTQLTDLLDSIVKKEISGALTPEVLKDIIVKLVTHCRAQENFDLEVLLSEADKEALRKVFGKALQDEIKGGITLKASPNVEKGFRIGQKGKDLYYDFSDEAIAEAFNAYLNQKLKLIMDAGLRNGQ